MGRFSRLAQDEIDHIKAVISEADRVKVEVIARQITAHEARIDLMTEWRKDTSLSAYTFARYDDAIKSMNCDCDELVSQIEEMVNKYTLEHCTLAQLTPA